MLTIINNTISIVHLSTNTIESFIFSVNTNTTIATNASTTETIFQILLRFIVSSSSSCLDTRSKIPNNTEPIAEIKFINAQCPLPAISGVEFGSIIISVSSVAIGLGVLVGSIVGLAVGFEVGAGVDVGFGVTFCPPPFIGVRGTTIASHIPFSSFHTVLAGQPLGFSVGSGFGSGFFVIVSLPSSYLMA